RLVACLAQEMGDGFRVQALRLDSGNLLALSVRARRLLDEAGLQRVGLVASGGLDEYEVDRLVRAGAPFTIYAVGTNVGVSLDAPKLDSAYKLVAYGGRGRMKLSPDKATLPGRKQVFRRMRDGEAAEDVIALAEETLDSEPLLQEVMHNGKRLPAGRATLEESRRLAAVSLAQIPSHLRNLSPADPPYRVTVSDVLQRAQDELSRQVGGAPAVPWRPKRSR
ncbi:MAG TPA: nicotinate phosphoribosyltransferase, partial [Dehalococcoidia bacterium]|nr:nicotinate phosphoribosyltransferase [Dehalococcoidia bacterium]